RGLLELGIDGIAVERRLVRHAVLELAGGLGMSGQVTRMRTLEPRTGGFTKSAAEIDIAGLVARRVGVRHVRCEHLEAARADGERLGMDAERGVDQLAHIRNIPEAGFGRSRASSVP